jgi:serine/threonine protein kinase
MEQPGFRRMRTGIFKTEDALLNNMSSTGFKRQPTKRTKAVLSTNKLKLTKDKKEGGKKKVNQYVLEKKLGEGSFAAVFLCTDSNTKQKYAIKQMNKR